MEFGGFPGRGFQLLIQETLLGPALFLESSFRLGDGLFEGVDISAELVELGAGGVEPVVLLEDLLVLGETFSNGRLAVDETLIIFDASGMLAGFGFVLGYFGLESGYLATDVFRFGSPALQVLNLQPEIVGAKVFSLLNLERGRRGPGRRRLILPEAGPWRRFPGA